MVSNGFTHWQLISSRILELIYQEVKNIIHVAIEKNLKSFEQLNKKFNKQLYLYIYISTLRIANISQSSYEIIQHPIHKRNLYKGYIFFLSLSLLGPSLVPERKNLGTYKGLKNHAGHYRNNYDY